MITGSKVFLLQKKFRDISAADCKGGTLPQSVTRGFYGFSHYGILEFVPALDVVT
jgi:hypothetical protein